MTVQEAYRAIKREYYAAHRERILALRKRIREEKAESIRAYRKAYRAKNREKINQQNSAYYRKNREARLAYHRERRAAARSDMARGRPRMESSPMAGVRQGGLMGSDGCNGAVTCS
jgi:hypothetical protein